MTFSAKIHIIGVNPYVLLPATVLKALFKEAGKTTGPIPVSGKIDGHPFIQTLVKYSGKWRLYLNGPMRKAAGKDVGDRAEFSIAFDPEERIVPMHPGLVAALKKNKNAKKVFDALTPHRQKEINRYLNALKTAATVEKNITKAVAFLEGKERFVGRDKA